MSRQNGGSRLAQPHLWKDRGASPGHWLPSFAMWLLLLCSSSPVITAPVPHGSRSFREAQGDPEARVPKFSLTPQDKEKRERQARWVAGDTKERELSKFA